MSFFNKIFGGGDKKVEQKPVEQKPQVNEAVDKKIKMEGAMVNLDKQIKVFEDNQKKLDHKINMLKAKAKEYIEEGKKTQARKYAEEAKRVQKQLENYSLRRKVLVDKKFQLESAAMNKETIGAIEEANVHMKDQQKYTQKLQDLIFEGQQAKMQQDQINDKLRDLVDADDQDEDVDAMLNQLMGEVNRQKKQKMQVPSKKVQVNVPQQKNKPQQRDEIEDMLNAL